MVTRSWTIAAPLVVGLAFGPTPCVTPIDLVGEAWAIAEEPVTATTGSDWRLIRRIETPHGLLRDIAFSADGRWLAAACAEPGESFHSPVRGTIVLLETATLTVRRVFRSGQFGAPDAVAFNADATSVAACWEHGTVMLWNCRTGELEKTLPGPPDAGHAATLTPNAAFAAWSCKDGTIRVWGLTEQGRRVALKADGFLHLATSADGKRIAAAGRVIRTGKSTFYIPTGQAEDAMVWNVDRTSHEVTLKGHARGIAALAFSPDAEVFATGGADGIVKLWHLPTRLPLLADIKAHRHGVDRVAFSPNGRMLATGGAFDPDVKIWDVGSGALLTALSWTDDPKPDSMLIPIAFSPDGGSLAVAAEEGIVAVWRVPTPDPSSVQE